MVQHYAKIENNIVVDIHLVADSLVENGGEQAGADMLSSLWGGEFIRFSKSGEFRYNRARVGDTYYRERDAFIAPQPFPSWTLDKQTCQWIPPIPEPAEGEYYWDEPSYSWVLLQS